MMAIPYYPVSFFFRSEAGANHERALYNEDCKESKFKSGCFSNQRHYHHGHHGMVSIDNKSGEDKIVVTDETQQEVKSLPGMADVKKQARSLSFVGDNGRLPLEAKSPNNAIKDSPTTVPAHTTSTLKVGRERRCVSLPPALPEKDNQKMSVKSLRRATQAFILESKAVIKRGSHAAKKIPYVKRLMRQRSKELSYALKQTTADGTMSFRKANKFGKLIWIVFAVVLLLLCSYQLYELINTYIQGQISTKVKLSHISNIPNIIFRFILLNNMGLDFRKAGIENDTGLQRIVLGSLNLFSNPTHDEYPRCPSMKSRFRSRSDLVDTTQKSFLAETTLKKSFPHQLQKKLYPGPEFMKFHYVQQNVSNDNLISVNKNLTQLMASHGSVLYLPSDIPISLVHAGFNFEIGPEECNKMSNYHLKLQFSEEAPKVDEAKGLSLTTCNGEIYDIFLTRIWSSKSSHQCLQEFDYSSASCTGICWKYQAIKHKGCIPYLGESTNLTGADWCNAFLTPNLSCVDKLDYCSEACSKCIRCQPCQQFDYRVVVSKTPHSCLKNGSTTTCLKSTRIHIHVLGLKSVLHFEDENTYTLTIAMSNMGGMLSVCIAVYKGFLSAMNKMHGMADRLARKVSQEIRTEFQIDNGDRADFLA